MFTVRITFLDCIDEYGYVSKVAIGNREYYFEDVEKERL